MDNSLFGLALPALGSAVSAARQLASAAVEPFAAVLQAAGKQQSPESKPYATRLQELSPQSSDRAADLESRIRLALEVSGIEIDEPLRLRVSDFDGQIEIVDHHPQRALLEAALNENTELVKDFQEYSAVAGYFEAGQDALLLLEPQHASSFLSR